MSEMCEIYSSLKQVKSEKRRANRENGFGELARLGVKFESRNDGAHLVVKDFGVAMDYWPGTGLWVVRGRERKQRGIRGLVNFLENKRSFSVDGVVNAAVDLATFTRSVNRLSRDRRGATASVVYNEGFLKLWFDRGVSAEDCWKAICDLEDDVEAEKASLVGLGEKL